MILSASGVLKESQRAARKAVLLSYKLVGRQGVEFENTAYLTFS